MAQLTMRKADGTEGGSIDLDDATFGVQPNVPLMHQVVTAQLAAARAGTQSTKTRSEVSGGGAKPFKQKGTGRSRQGTTRAPQWTGGGVALGPKPRSYKQRTPKKMVKAALRSALSDRFAEGRVVVLDGGFGFTEAKTRQAVALLDALDLEGSILVVVSRDDEAAIKAFRNLPYAQVLLDEELNAYDVLCNDWIVFTDANLPSAPEGTGRKARDAGAAGATGGGAAADGGQATDGGTAGSTRTGAASGGGTSAEADPPGAGSTGADAGSTGAGADASTGAGAEASTGAGADAGSTGAGSTGTGAGSTGADAGSTGAGSTGTDAGSTGTDAGSTGTGAGSTGADAGSTGAGSTGTDAGSTGADAGSTGTDAGGEATAGDQTATDEGSQS